MKVKYTRWAIVFKHDGSPADGGIFVHKPAAEKALKKKSGRNHMRVTRVEITEVENG